MLLAAAEFARGNPDNRNEAVAVGHCEPALVDEVDTMRIGYAVGHQLHEVVSDDAQAVGAGFDGNRENEQAVEAKAGNDQPAVIGREAYVLGASRACKRRADGVAGPEFQLLQHLGTLKNPPGKLDESWL